MNAALNHDRVPLDDADKQLLAEIRTLATALLDGPARWDTLHAQICEAKHRKLHRKLGIKWSGFLHEVGITEDDWSRIVVAVDICRVLRRAGLPLPRNHGQIDQLRFLRRDPAALTGFWQKAVNDYGSIPPARVLAGMKMTAATEKPAGHVSHPKASPDLVGLAKEYLDLMRAGELFDAQRPAQQLAGLLLGTPLNDTKAWLVWPRPRVLPKQLQFELGDVRRPRRRRTSSRSVGTNLDDPQLSFDFGGHGEPPMPNGSASRKFREIRGISADACTDAPTGVTNSAEPPSVQSTLRVPVTVVGPVAVELMSDDVQNATCNEDDPSRLKAPTRRSGASGGRNRKSGERAVVKVSPNGAAVMWEFVRDGSKLCVRITMMVGTSTASLIDAPPGYALTRCKRHTRLEKSLRDVEAATLDEEVARAIRHLVSRGSEITRCFGHLRPIRQDEPQTEAGPGGKGA